MTTAKIQVKLRPNVSLIAPTPTVAPTTTCEIANCDGLTYLEKVNNGSIDLILTDPPYIISHDTGMDTLHQQITRNDIDGVEFVKSDHEWVQYKADNEITDDTNKDNYLRYGTPYGRKYSVQTNFGDWDKDFTMETLDQFMAQFYAKLKHGGVMIIFFDIWKISYLKEMMEKHKFKQIRFIEWIKDNPQPLNSKVNYLTNCREIALLGVKGGSSTFNGSYDKGIYEYPIQGGKNRFHPTQKSLELFKDLINKHSNPGDTIMDTFLGGGTTALACKQTGRHFKGCDISKEYCDRVSTILRNNPV
jgi:site-specific DNA-methyltransferase (adenine-specific)